MRGEAPVTLLKRILENLRTPERLHAHPWIASLTVQEAVRQDPGLGRKSPGAQLTLAIGALFREMQPATPPDGGKRIDTRWGRFGILAADYFAPLLYGRIYPRTLREAWRRIDPAILLFVYGKAAEELTPQQVRAYQLIGDESVFAANSTISDWHRSGLQDLAELFLNREKHLSLTLQKPSTVLEEETAGRSGAARKIAARPSRLLLYGFAAFLLISIVAGLVAAGAKGWSVYQRLQAVKSDLGRFADLDVTAVDSLDLEQVGPLLDQTHTDIESLRADAEPWLWLGPALAWIPVYGGDLEYSADLLELASDFSGSASLAHKSALPVWQSIRQNDSEITATELTSMLLDSQPLLLQSQTMLRRAIEARQRIAVERLSPTTRSWLAPADRYLGALDQGLSLALSLPRLLGGSGEGPKTYLVLIQNEDELRPTGGFITAVGKLVVWKGQLISWDVADSYSVDDIDKAYPRAPWQMQSFMNIPIMTFRDSNWFPDYPTAVQWAEYLYAYTNSYSVNGVIAIDQHVLKTLLAVTGPVYVNDIGATINSDNVVEVMRAQKVPPAAELRDPNWYRKRFMNPIARSILDHFLSGAGISWERLIRAMVEELDQRHMLIQLDDPVLSQLLAERNWDGTIERIDGDFLAVIDTNVGYNKTNAVVSTRLSYDIDLSTLTVPTSTLQVFQHNGSSGDPGPCDQRPGGIDRSALEYWYPIDRCYYDYLRVYLPAGSQLLGATPHAVSRNEMIMLDQDVPARVDSLDEDLKGLQGFGTLLVVQIGNTLETDFQFQLPPNILQVDPTGRYRMYRLRIQKQPGTTAIPVTIRVHLPQGARLEAVSPENYVQSGSSLLFELNLATDVVVQIQFGP